MLRQNGSDNRNGMQMQVSRQRRKAATQIQAFVYRYVASHVFNSRLVAVLVLVLQTQCGTCCTGRQNLLQQDWHNLPPGE